MTLAPPAVRAECVVAPFLVSRVGALAPQRLDCLRLTRGAELSVALAEAEQAMVEVAPALASALHTLVPRLDGDRTLSRAALALKRDVHNARTPSAPGEVLDAIELQLESLDRRRLRAWLDAEGHRRRTLEAGRLLADEEREAAGRLLVQELLLPDVEAAVAMASASFALDLRRADRAAAARPASRLSRSAVAYLVRAALKTSPFSTLTRVGLAAFDGGRDAPSLPVARRTVSMPQALATELLLACATDPQLAPAFAYRPADRVAGHDGCGRVLVPRRSCLDGFLWRHDAVTSSAVYDADLDALAGPLPRSLARCLEALGGNHTQASFLRLVAMGLVRPVAPWSMDDSRPLRALADAVSPWGETGAAVAIALRELDAAARNLLDVPAPERATAVSALPARVSASFAALGRTRPAWLRSMVIAHEDASTPVLVPPLGDAVREDLRRLGSRLGPTMFRTRLYDRLVERFLARHGRHGVCEDVYGFLLSIFDGADGGMMLSASAAADGRRIGRPLIPEARGECGPGMVSPSAAVLFQVAADSHAQILAGEHLLVVNQFAAGVGGLLARFIPLLAGEPSLGDQLRHWIRGLVGDAEVVEVPVAADATGLQRPTGLHPVLRWPGETPTGDVGVELADLRLTYDDGSGTLVLRRRDGRPVVPVYLGTVPQHLVAGPLRVLTTLGDPWVVGVRAGGQRGPMDAPAAVHDVEWSPRQTDGRIVLRRATWTVPPDQFPRHGSREPTFDYLHRVARWRTRHSMPEEVFLSVDRPSMTLEAKRRKPIWVSFDSVHTLAVAAHLVDDEAVAVRLVEVLPTRIQAWTEGADGARRATELVASLAWPRQEDRPA